MMLGLGLSITRGGGSVLYPGADLVIDAFGRYGAQIFRKSGVSYQTLAAMITAGAATFSRAGDAYLTLSNGTLQNFTSGQARNAAQVGFLPEEGRTNLFPRWAPTVAQLSVSTSASNTTEPASPPVSGLNWIAIDNSAGNASAYQAVTVSGSTAYVVSILVETPDGSQPVVGANTVSGDFRVLVGGGTMSSEVFGYTRLSGNVWRVDVSGVSTGSPSANSGVIRYSTQNTRALKFSGFNIQAGTFPLSLIATTGSAASRAADNLSVPYVLPSGDCDVEVRWRNEQTPPVAGIRPIEWHDGTTDNRLIIQGSLGDVAAFVSNGGVTTQIGSGAAGLTGARTLDAMIRRRSGTWEFWVNGAQQGAALSASAPAVNTVRIGCSQTGDQYTNSPIHSVVVTPR